MAKLTMGILGPFTGKVGDVVGYVWRGRQVVRAYRRHIHYPDTALQQRERQWFVAMVRFAATARGALLLGLRERAAAWQMTEGNAFVKMNKGCFGLTPGPSPIASPPTPLPRERGVDADGGVRVDYERIKISEGAAAPVRFTAAAVDDYGVLRVDFEKNSGMTRAKGTDRVYIYVYNTETREGLLSAAAPRWRGHLDMQLPEGWNGLNTRMWGFVVDGEGRASGSQYVALAEPGVSEVPDISGIESPDGTFEKEEGMGQAIKRVPLRGTMRMIRQGLPKIRKGFDMGEKKEAGCIGNLPVR